MHHVCHTCLLFINVTVASDRGGLVAWRAASFTDANLSPVDVASFPAISEESTNSVCFHHSTDSPMRLTELLLL